MKKFDKNFYNIYNSQFFNKFKSAFLRKGLNSKIENSLYFLFKNLKKKNYSVFLFFLLVKNSYLPFPSVKVYQNKGTSELKPTYSLGESYGHGLKTLEKYNKRTNTYFNNLSDSVWSLLLTESYFYEKRSLYFENFWLSRLLRPTTRNRKKRFKKKKYFVAK